MLRGIIRKQDIWVLLLYQIGYSRIRNLVLRIRRKPVSRFVIFHDIASEALGTFESHLRFLKDSTNVVDLDDFFEGRLSSDLINTVITFDDGYKSWVSIALPLLKELGLPAIFFVSAGSVGLSKESEAQFIRSKFFPGRKIIPKVSGTLSLDDLRKIAGEGFSLGGHSLNHANLAELRDRDRLIYEIAEDKRILEKVTGKKIDYFSYPFGACVNPEIDIPELLRKSGYNGAVTTMSGPNYPCTAPLFLRREITPACMHNRVFRSRVYGNYDAVRFIKALLRARSVTGRGFFSHGTSK